MIRGEAGIGKTRLVEAALGCAKTRGFCSHRILLFDTGTAGSDAAAAGLIRWLLGVPPGEDQGALRTAVSTSCDDPHAHLFMLDALGVALSDAKRRFYQALDISGRRSGMRRAIAQLLWASSELQALALVVEDIHWADPALLGLLADLGADAASVPVLMLLTGRTEGEPLAQAWRGAMQGTPLTTLDMGPLRLEVAHEIAREIGGSDQVWVEQCIRRAGGNPLFLEHLLREEPGLDDAVPASVQGLVERRLDRLGAEERRAVQAAAVLGQRFSAEALTALLGRRRDPCLALFEAQLLRREGDLFRSTHALVRVGVRQSIAEPALRALHRKAARWYAIRDPLRHPEHLEQAADPVAAVAWLDAARGCLNGHRYDEALSCAERAWRIGSAAETGLFLASLQRELGDIRGSPRVLETVIDGCEDVSFLCDARVELAAALLVQDDYAEALVNLDAAGLVAASLGDDVRLARLHYHRGNAFFPLGRLDECMAAHGTALDHARQAGDPELEARALSGLADAHYLRGRMVTAHHYYDRCVRLCEAFDLVRVQAPNLAGRAMAALYLNRVTESISDSESAVSLAALTRSQRDECMACNVLAIASYYAGDFGRLELESEQGLAIARAIGLRRFEADHLCMRGVVRAISGQIADGLADLTAALELIRDQDMLNGGPWILGFQALLVDDPDLRRGYQAEGEAALDSDSVSHNHFQFRQCALEVALQERERSAVERHAQALETYARDEPLPWSDFHIARARALMDWADGDRREALVNRLRTLEAEACQAGLTSAAQGISAALQSEGA